MQFSGRIIICLNILTIQALIRLCIQCLRTYHMHMHTHMHTHACTHVHTHAHMREVTCTLARTHACIGTLTHTYTHRKKGKKKKSINGGMTMNENFRLSENQRDKHKLQSAGLQMTLAPLRLETGLLFHVAARLFRSRSTVTCGMACLQ